MELWLNTKLSILWYTIKSSLVSSLFELQQQNWRFCWDYSFTSSLRLESYFKTCLYFFFKNPYSSRKLTYIPLRECSFCLNVDFTWNISPSKDWSLSCQRNSILITFYGFFFIVNQGNYCNYISCLTKKKYL